MNPEQAFLRAKQPFWSVKQPFWSVKQPYRYVKQPFWSVKQSCRCKDKGDKAFRQPRRYSGQTIVRRRQVISGFFQRGRRAELLVGLPTAETMENQGMISWQIPSLPSFRPSFRDFRVKNKYHSCTTAALYRQTSTISGLTTVPSFFS